MSDWQWIPPTVAAGLGVPAVGLFLMKVIGSRIKDMREGISLQLTEIKGQLNRVNGSTRKNTSDISALKATCKEREAFMRRF